MAFAASIASLTMLTDGAAMAFAASIASLIMLTDGAAMAFTAIIALFPMLTKSTSVALPAEVALLAVRTLRHPKGWLCVCLPCGFWVDERTDGCGQLPPRSPLRVQLPPVAQSRTGRLDIGLYPLQSLGVPWGALLDD